MQIYRITTVLMLVISTLSFSVHTTTAQDVNSINGVLQFLADDSAASDEFGAAVALDGDTLLVGAPGADNGVGAAYVFVKSGETWSQQAKLIPSDSATSGYGTAVALQNDTAVVTALSDGVDRSGTFYGAGYVFTRSGTTWTQQDKLTRSFDTSRTAFGETVALDGNTALMGDRLDGTSGFDAGSVFVFVRSNGDWSRLARLFAGSQNGFEEFGTSIDLEGETALIGAPKENSDGRTQNGAVYLFTGSGSGWSENARLAPNDPTSGALFGSAVALNGNQALIGAVNAAYVFVNDRTWQQQTKLTGTPGDNFGASVALQGDLAFIGASTANSGEGATFLYLRNQFNLWNLLREFNRPGSSTGDGFGAALALDGEIAFVGMPTTNGTESGFAYLFVPPPEDVNGDTFVTPADAIFVINRVGNPPTGDNAPADVNGDNSINQIDVQAVIAAIGR